MVSIFLKKLLNMFYYIYIKNNDKIMNISKKLREGLNEVLSKKPWYRIEREFKGDLMKLIPKNYYEEVDEYGDLVMFHGEAVENEDTPEVSVAEYVGGAVIGAFSMDVHMNYEGARKAATKLGEYYAYVTYEVPDIDMTHVTHGDFELIREARYRRPVDFKYMGKVILSDREKELIIKYYEFINRNGYDDAEMVGGDWDFIRNGGIQKVLNNVKIIK